MSLRHIVSTLAGELREYKLLTILTPCFVVLEVLMEVLIPFYLGDLIDTGMDAEHYSSIFEPAAFLITLALLSILFGSIVGRLSAKASAGYAKNLRHAMFEKVQYFSISNINKYSTSSIITRLTTDTTNIQNAFMSVIRSAIRAPVMFIAAFIMVLIIRPEISLIFLLVVVFLGVGILHLNGKIFPLSKQVSKAYDSLNNIVLENIRGIRVVKSFTKDLSEKTKGFKDASSAIYKDFTALLAPVMQFCIYACIIAIVLFGGQMIIHDHFTSGELVSLISYSLQILVGFKTLSSAFITITKARSSSIRIVEILDENPAVTNPKKPVMTVATGSIVFENVSFSYAKDTPSTLEKINLEIASGETIGILGNTGSGKTTLVKLIPRLYDVTSGSVLVGGVDVRKYDTSVLRNAVAIVLQKNILFSGTILENLYWGNPEATEDEIIEAARLAQADEFIEKLPDKYNTYIEQGGSNLSGGQRQRICLARTLLRKPKILILDDSTSAVDTKTESLIKKALHEYLPDTTKIIIANRISSLEEADRIVILNNGQIHDIGTHRELLARSVIYQEMYRSQTKGDE